MVYDKVVLLAARNDENTRKLAEILNSSKIKVYFCGSNGAALLEMLEDLNADAVIMDCFMRYIDGVGVLSRINKMNPVDRPLTVVMSAIDDDTYQKEFFAFGADYCVLKPIEPQLMVERIIQMLSWKDVGVFANSQTTNEMEYSISIILRKLGILPNMKGYRYLREAIMLAIDNPLIINAVTRELYPCIAEKYNCDAGSVERAIRYAVRKAWKKGNISLYKTYFGCAVENPQRPTNSELIASIADDLRFKMKMHMELDGPYKCANLF